MKKTLQINITMNDSYDTVLCHTDHSLQCWSEMFFFQFSQNVCLLLSLCMHILLIFLKVV